MKTGFTLIELLVVVLIIGILAAVALPQYEKAVTKARYMEAKVILKNLAEAIQLYILANGATPATLEDLDITPPTSSNFTYAIFRCVSTPAQQGCNIMATPTRSDFPIIHTETKDYDPAAPLFNIFVIRTTPGAGEVAECSRYGGKMVRAGYDEVCAM